MPRPSLGFALQSLPLAGSRDPSRGPVAPLRSSTDVPPAWHRPRLHRPFPRRPHPPREERAVAWFPERLWTSFPRGSCGLPPLPARPWRARPAQAFRQLHPLRSLDPPANPFASAPTGLPRSQPRVAPKPPRNDPLRSRPIVTAGRCSPGLRPTRGALEARALSDPHRPLRAGARTLVPCATRPRPRGDPHERSPVR